MRKHRTYLYFEQTHEILKFMGCRRKLTKERMDICHIEFKINLEMKKAILKTTKSYGFSKSSNRRLTRRFTIQNSNLWSERLSKGKGLIVWLVIKPGVQVLVPGPKQ